MIPLQRTVISQLLNDKTALCTSDQRETFKAFAFAIKVYFGITPKTVEKEVYELGFKQIQEKYPNITFEQLNLSYSEGSFEKKQGVSLTVTELMYPVALFWQKTQFVLHHADKIKREEEQKAEIEAKRQAFKDEAIRLYIQCVNSDKIWIGTAFQANVFAKESFAHRFSQPEKDQFFSQAKWEVKELTAKQNLSLMDGLAFDIPVVNEVQMFSQIVVTEACKRGFEVIIE